jgi:hypothetical protein
MYSMKIKKFAPGLGQTLLTKDFLIGIWANENLARMTIFPMPIYAEIV